MAEDKKVGIIKGAMLLEQRGKTFYQSVAQKTESDAVQQIFSIMVAEETKHIQILKGVLDKMQKEGKFVVEGLEDKPTNIAEKVLTSKVREQISASGFEAAAVSAAIAMENQAIRYYGQSADSAQEQKEKELYQWLADWERTHLDFLTQVDQELRESIWFDQKFWPSI